MEIAGREGIMMKIWILEKNSQGDQHANCTEIRDK